MNNLCPACGASYQVSPEHIGRKVKCKKCQSRLVVTPEGLALEAAYVAAPPPVKMASNVNELASYDDDDDDSFVETRRPRKRKSNNPVVDFLTFRIMNTPYLTQILFWIGTFPCIFYGFRIIVISFDMPTFAFEERGLTKVGSFSYTFFLIGLYMMIGGPLLIRLCCEIAYHIYGFHMELKKQTDLARRRQG